MFQHHSTLGEHVSGRACLGKMLRKKDTNTRGVRSNFCTNSDGGVGGCQTDEAARLRGK